MKDLFLEQSVWAAFEPLLQELEELDSSLAKNCEAMEGQLRSLTELFKDLPSIMDGRSIGKEHRSKETLLASILEYGVDHTLVLPTKVIVGRAMLVCRFNFLGFLVKLCTSYPSISKFQENFQREWEAVLFLLMLDDLYRALVEGHEHYGEELRRRAANELIHLWEYRSNEQVGEYARAIVELWKARRKIAPVFGTMMGTVELFRISMLLSSRWQDFLMKNSGKPEIVEALEEFVFGLVYEDLERARSAMREQELNAIDRDTIIRLLGTADVYCDVNQFDPRELYRFFKIRLSSGARRRIANTLGPRRTIEELVLAHFLSETELL